MSFVSYCAFHKHANSKVHKPSQLRFSLPSITITITNNEPWNTETHKTDRNPPITNHKPWPFEPFKVKFCFLRGPFNRVTRMGSHMADFLGKDSSSYLRLAHVPECLYCRWKVKCSTFSLKNGSIHKNRKWLSSGIAKITVFAQKWPRWGLWLATSQNRL